jgi:hypothetical protein
MDKHDESAKQVQRAMSNCQWNSVICEHCAGLIAESIRKAAADEREACWTAVHRVGLLDENDEWKDPDKLKQDVLDAILARGKAGGV